MTQATAERAATKYQWRLLPNSPVANSRTDDIWFFDSVTGWLVNSSGYVCKTEDGGNSWVPKFFLYPNLPSRPYLRCMSWANRKIGWFGAVTGIGLPPPLVSPSQYLPTLLHRTTDGGETWKPVENLPEGSPGGICGFHAVNERVAYGSGTNDPGLPGPAIIKTMDGGASWELIPMEKYASNLIDIYFFDENNGFVVGGKIDTKCPLVQKDRDGTNDPGLPGPAIIKTMDGGASWDLIPMEKYASNLIDIYFFDENNGFVVGGKIDTKCPLVQKDRDGNNAYPPPRLVRYAQVKPVVLRTTNGGKTWQDTAESIKDFECGEWGWKIQFLNNKQGFVALENFRDANILVTTDGGDSWVRKHVAKNQDPSSPAINNDLEGIGFINAKQGWVGGWGFQALNLPVGGLENSYTEDGGDTWIAQNHNPNPDVPSDPRYRINRYRFVKDLEGNTVGYCSGQQVFKLDTRSGTKKQTFAARSEAAERVEPANSSHGILISTLAGQPIAPFEPDHGFDLDVGPAGEGAVRISYTLPEAADNVFLGLWNKFAFHVRTLVSEDSQTRGRRTVLWDGRDDRGEAAGPGVYILRMCTAGEKGTSRMVEWAGAG